MVILCFCGCSTITFLLYFFFWDVYHLITGFLDIFNGITKFLSIYQGLTS